MSLVPNVGRKAWSVRFFILWVYSSLIVLGATMVVPFLITITSSTTNDYDYYRFWPVPRYFWSSSDRYVKGIVPYFNSYRNWSEQMKAYIPDTPSHWTSWQVIGRDVQASDKLAGKYLDVSDKEKELQKLRAADYSEFSDSYSLLDTEVAVQMIQGVTFLHNYYDELYAKKYPQKAEDASRSERREASLKLLSKTWGLPFESFYNAQFDTEMKYPMGFQGWFPPVEDPKYKDYLRLKVAYKGQFFTPGVQSKWLSHLDRKNIEYKNLEEVFPVTQETKENIRKLWISFKAEIAPASPALPFALRAVWYSYLQSEDVEAMLKLDAADEFTIDTYNKIAGTNYKSLEDTPFPVPAVFPKKMQELWNSFLKERYPLRLTSFKLTADLQKQYSVFLKKEIKHLRIANKLLGRNYTSWSEFKLNGTPSFGELEVDRNRRSIWKNFVKQLPADKKITTSSEIEYQRFVLKKYGSLKNINKAYGWSLKHINEAFPPIMDAYTVTFRHNEMAMTFMPIFGNYSIIVDYLLLNANAVPVTFFLIALTIICTLTINPLAAYAMSRFNLRGQTKILLFMLATMAFPAMVSAIPAYLLMRDLGMLNTFLALVLPGAANGMAIFILKGFFDSLPQELFEAATIDGASEMQIFRIVAMPLVKPILAINCFTAFVLAYNGWQWALIICQKKSMWTIAVWLYQASCWWSSMPWIVSAGFVIASVPTFLMFVFCQKLILRGIIIPSMK